MKFIHLADCHVGAWREPKMRALTEQAFARAIRIAIEERVDFVIIAGDLFHTAIPAIDSVKTVFRALKTLRDEGIPLYFITGSHDYSPSGKTMLDLIEEAALGRNLFRGEVVDGMLRLTWTVDEHTGVKLTGVLGRANQLDSAFYAQLNRGVLEDEPNTKGKIFVFHTSLEELTPHSSVIDTAPLSMLPRGCDYYAGGHVHTRVEERIQGKLIAYPGPVFPASFSELEELGAGGIILVEDWNIRRVPIEVKRVVSRTIDATKKAPMDVAALVLDDLTAADVKDAIVTIRLIGTLTGKATDIPWTTIIDELTARGAYAVLRNTAAIMTPTIERTVIATGSLEDIETAVIREHKLDVAAVKRLMQALSSELRDGEKRAGYEERVIGDALQAMTEGKEKRTE